MTTLPPRVARDGEDFLIETVRYVIAEAMSEVDLLTVPSSKFRSQGTQFSAQRMREIIAVAQTWVERGYGRLGLNGRPIFSFSEAGKNAAKIIAKHRSRRTLRQRLATWNWNAVNAVAAMIAAIAAIIAAYFSYLSAVH